MITATDCARSGVDRNRMAQAVRALNAPAPRLEPDPLPFPPGLPGWQLWCERFTPPTGLEFLGAVPTEKAWCLPCPSCVQGWTLLVPSADDPYGYDIDLTVDCSRGCDPAEVAWLHLWRLGELPLGKPLPWAEPDDQQRRWARGGVRQLLLELCENPAFAEVQVRRRAYRIGQLSKAAVLDNEIITAALRRAVPPSMLHAAIQAFTAGLARPARLP